MGNIIYWSSKVDTEQACNWLLEQEVERNMDEEFRESYETRQSTIIHIEKKSF